MRSNENRRSGPEGSIKDKRGLPPLTEPVELNESVTAVARLTLGPERGSVPQTEEA
jgi:hypothetical protein